MHVVDADLSDYGAMDQNCITLAELAATAVDFPKTGKIVSMPSHLKPKLYPDFVGKQSHQSYKSKKFLGRLYRRIRDAYDEDLDSTSLKHVTEDIPYDASLDVPGAAEFINDAWEQKCCYDGQLNGLLRVCLEQRLSIGLVSIGLVVILLLIKAKLCNVICVWIDDCQLGFCRNEKNGVFGTTIVNWAFVIMIKEKCN